MKNAVKYLLAGILALLIFYGGSGVNLMSYCCNDCRSEGVAVVLVDKCCEIHEHEHHICSHSQHSTHETNCTEEHSHETTSCCDMERVSFEWDSNHFTIEKPEPVVMDLLSVALPVLSLLTTSEDLTQASVERENPPPIVCPRVYLSLLTTLLI